MALQYSIDDAALRGINHADFSIDGRYAIFTCEFTGSVAKIDLVNRKVRGYLQLLKPGVPTQTVKGIDAATRSSARLEGHAAGHPRLARRQDVSTSPT